MTVLVVNHGIDRRCGVHSFGARFHQSIANSKHNVIYAEINSLVDYFSICEQHQPNVVIFNYMPIVLPWVTSEITRYKTTRIALQHLYDNATIDSVIASHAGIFDYVAVLDPSVVTNNPRIIVLPRVLPPAMPAPLPEYEPIRIGTFGFALPHKQIPLIAEEINRCFDSAIFNLHITEAYFNGAGGQNVYTDDIVQSCRKAITKPAIHLEVTTDFCSDSEIVNRLSRNHINALFYSIPPENIGRSSSIDYMISAERPILVTHCDSFKHADHLISKYPETQFSDIANNYQHYLSLATELKQSMTADIVTSFDSMIESIS